MMKQRWGLDRSNNVINPLSFLYLGHIEENRQNRSPIRRCLYFWRAVCICRSNSAWVLDSTGSCCWNCAAQIARISAVYRIVSRRAPPSNNRFNNTHFLFLFDTYISLLWRISRHVVVVALLLWCKVSTFRYMRFVVDVCTRTGAL